jgi:hypothetical protein
MLRSAGSITSTGYCHPRTYSHPGATAITELTGPTPHVNQQAHQSHTIVPAPHPAQGGLHLRRVDIVPLHRERRGTEEVVPIQH